MIIRLGLCGLVGAGSLLAQSWSLVGTTPVVDFGVAGDLLVRDAVGPIGYDETAAATLQPAVGGGWTAQPAAPAPRQYATLAAGNRAYLFGGGSTAGLANDLWYFDRAQSAWTLMAGTPNPIGPSPRLGAKAASIGGGILVFFGGVDGSGWLADTWVMFDVGGAPFWVQRPTPAALVGRFGHAMSAAPGGNVMLFGGQTAAGANGDTWLFGQSASSWTRYVGVSPPAAADCRMTYDVGRDMVVLAHPNGDTWEWDGIRWRRPGISAPTAWAQPALAYDPVQGVVRAWQRQGTLLEQYRYTPSLAEWQWTIDLTCTAAGELELGPVQRSLPILGQTMHLRGKGMSPTALFFGVYEFSTQPWVPIGCGCVLGVTGVGAGVQYVPGIGGQWDWFLPIPNVAALNGVPIDVQGVVLDLGAPCYLMTTQRGMIVPGF